MLVFALLLSQVLLYRERCGRNCILLLDDLSAELDINHRERVTELLHEMAVQTFVTSVKKDNIQYQKWQPHTLFHVEQGQINEVV
jgi:DNA replication and repair protein RecF